MRRVVVGIGSASPGSAVLAVAGAEARSRGMQLQVVSVWSYPAMSPGEPWSDLVGRLGDETEAIARRHVDEVLGPEGERGCPVELIIRSGSPAGELLQIAEGADLLVIGRRDKSRLEQLWLGSVAAQCVQHPPCPVMVVPTVDAGEVPGDAPLLVGIDGSDHAGRALVWALAEGERQGRPVRVVHGWTEPGAGIGGWGGSAAGTRGVQEDLSRQLDGWIEAAAPPNPSTVEGIVQWGPASNVLVAEAAGAAMVVVGTRGRGGFARLLLGSVSRNVLNQAPCPVVLLP